ncbi:Sensor protein QseC [Cupriavidus yeoncheonensis]|uniref:histidine kinase n=1 Tax=Cupriavidus yeoncheonensis TaxID=1462994 RepID=A0A916IWK6_9BURK|nr:ATP-binding protein [Cupriavidus yeoncheonensis]CAG2152849.1 Sensor protein QseC [Cupriavidus yeoncheonensis]
MDGLKGRIGQSIRLRLSLWLSVSILAVAAVAGAFSFIAAFDEAHELQDDILRQVAMLVRNRQLLLRSPVSGDDAQLQDNESRVIIQKLGGGQDQPPTQRLALPATLGDGLHTIEVGSVRYRVLVASVGGDRIAVAQDTAVRDEIARDSALRTLLPFLVLVPILLLVVAKLVDKMFRPIAALSAEIDRRSDQDLHPLAAGALPVEVRPFAVAINRLLGRIGQAIDLQRRFVADAAHELRSPLTALSLQAGRLADTPMPPAARERLGLLRQGIERTRNLLDQLLSMARAQSPGGFRVTASLSVKEVYRTVLEGLMPLAQAKQIDIGVTDGPDATVQASEADVLTIVRNLVDNALRYTPEQGRIDLTVSCADGRVVLSVEDNGPGIPQAERERVFDPFYRIMGTGAIGSGLGLSIVAAIARRLGADIRLDDAGCGTPAAPGLRISVLFPVATGSVLSERADAA